MTTTTCDIPKGFFDPGCDVDHNGLTCDENDQQRAIAHVFQRPGCEVNMDMLVDQPDTATHWVWVFDPKAAEPPETPTSDAAAPDGGAV